MTGPHTFTATPACEVKAPQAGLHPYLRLVIGIALILFFMFGLGSLSKFIPGAKHMARVIDERNLRATAIYYTDFEEPYEASQSIRASLEYPPGGK